MPLVADSVISTWYSRQSWVYRHFSYLWQNPLWQTRVPQGFSLCPYFWCALFSLFVFRPFVLAVLIGRMVVRFLHLGNAVKWMDAKVCHLIKTDTDKPFGAPTLLVFLFLVLGGFVIYGLGWAGYLLYVLGHATYLEYAEVGALPFFGLPILLALVLIVCLVYTVKVDDTRCQPEAYVRITAIGAVLIALFIDHSAMFAMLSIPLLGLWHGLCSIGVWLWWLVCHLGLGIVFAAKWVLAAVIGLTVALPLMLLGVAVFVGLAWLALRLERFTAKPVKEPTVEPKPEPLSSEKVRRIAAYALTRDVWSRLGNITDARSENYARRSPLLSAFLDEVIDASWASFCPSHITSCVRIHPRYDATVRAILAKFEKAETIRYAKREARAARCARITGAINAVFKPVGRGIAWPFKQGFVFGIYAWQMVKARKTRACPYLMFRD